MAHPSVLILHIIKGIFSLWPHSTLSSPQGGLQCLNEHYLPITNSELPVTIMSHSMPSVDLSQTRQPSLYASSTIPFSIAFLCVGLRFWCRWKNTAGLWLDDWLILASLVRTVAPAPG